ncbi:hypothetical protein HPP92_002649 [Vanilla planifolia]|uniref:RING-type domain-containing protein n=1 Tax=Vanilla planifolia TaxID=51239 RepID=A0A835SF16_VANPL|nr:hypothetical protein HPP92_002649 [Vanilla planifolia]
MGYDAMANNASVPVISRDFGKKKKGNRSAKLKQCKLDARREQWLSQVRNKGGRDGSPGALPTMPAAHQTVILPRPVQRGLESGSSKREARIDVEHDGPGFHDSGSDSPVRSPTQGRNMQRKDCSSTSGSSVGSWSRSVSDTEEDRQEEEKGEEKAGIDDWEAIADALSDVGDNNQMNTNSVQGKLDLKTKQNNHNDIRHCVGVLRPEINRVVHKAWRADDAARPQCLPNLSKQQSLPTNTERRFMAPGWICRVVDLTPSSCPICVEDFDLTDSRFLPCSCGFRICLFCHKKILEEGDGRCPGCRKVYDRVACMENSIAGAVLSMPYRFSRSCSMSSGS